MSTSATTGAQLSWVKTALGANFLAYLVQRLHPAAFDDTVSGWRTIAKLTNENRQTWTDVEARRNTSESYRMLVQDIFGGLSPFTATVSVTVPGSLIAITSNEDPTVNQDLGVKFPIHPKLPESRQLVAASGRSGQRLFRSSTRRGTEFDLTAFLRRTNVAAPTRGPAMWETLVTKLREDLSYVCLLTPYGDRYFIGAAVDGVDWNCPAEVDVPMQLVDVGSTPSIPTIAT
jgi:hypothetical protein